jgi:hypothetical protein
MATKVVVVICHCCYPPNKKRQNEQAFKGNKEQKRNRGEVPFFYIFKWSD